MSENVPQKYLVRDPQGNVYGPADVTTLRQWVQQGRIIAGMHIAAREDGAWIEVSAHPDLADLFRGSGPAQPVPPGITQAIPQTPPATVTAGPAAATFPAAPYPVTPVADAAGVPVSYAPVQAQSTNMPGLLSLIAGAASILLSCFALCCPIGGLFSVTAIILGAVGLHQIKAAPERYTGRGLAVGGLALGIIMTLLYIGAIIIFVVKAANNHP